MTYDLSNAVQQAAQAAGDSANTAQLANASNAFSLPANTDLMHQIFGIFFGGYGPFSDIARTTYTHTLSDMFFIMLSVLSALAVSTIAWHMTTSLVAVAQEGKLMQQKFSMIWGPIRVFCGFGALAPLKGYCLIQLAFMYTVLFGCGLGNTIMNRIVQTGQSAVSAPNLPATGALIADITKAEVCYSAGRVMGSTPGNLANGIIQYPDTYTTPVTSNIKTFAGNAVNAAVAMFEGTNYNSNNSFQRVTHEWDYGNCGQIQGVFASGYGHVAEFDKARLADIEKVRKQIHEAVTQVFQNVVAGSVDIDDYQQAISEGIGAALEAAKTSLDTSFTKEAETLVSQINSDNNTSNPEFSQAVSKYGFATFGPLYLSIAAQQTDVEHFANQLPALTYEQTQSEQRDTMQNLVRDKREQAYIQLINTAVAKKENDWYVASQNNAQANLDITHVAMTGMNVDTRVNNIDSAWNASVGKLSQIITLKLIDVHPALGEEISDVADFGSEVSALGKTLIVAGGAGKVAEMTTPEGAVAAPMTDGIFNKSLSTGFILTAVGAWHSYFLPRFFAMTWFTLIVGFVTFVVAGVICLPFLAYLMCRLDGQEMFSNEHKAGLSVFFHGFMTPTLLVFGGFVSIALIHASFMLLQTLVYPALFAQDMGIVAVCIMGLTLCFLHTQIIMQSFRFPTMLLSMFPRIVGLDANGPGAMADEGGMKEAGSKAFALVQNGGGSVAGAAKTATKQAESNAKNGVTEGAKATAQGVTEGLRNSSSFSPSARASARAGGAGAGAGAGNAAQNPAQNLSDAQGMGNAWTQNLARNLSAKTGQKFSGRDVANVLSEAGRHMQNNPAATLSESVRAGINSAGKEASDKAVSHIVNAVRGE